MSRPSWDEYFMSVSRLVATRATCPRRHVGAVVVINKRVLATGYNGSLPGSPHCDDVGCMITEPGGGCVRTIHAEQNALAQAASNGVALLGSSIYITTGPCLSCFKLIAAAGVKEIVYEQSYREEQFVSMARLAGMTVRKHDQFVQSRS